MKYLLKKDGRFLTCQFNGAINVPMFAAPTAAAAYTFDHQAALGLQAELGGELVEHITPITYPARPMKGGRFPAILPGKWHFEPKVNGWRALVHTPTGAMFNRHGSRLSIADEFKPALDQLQDCAAEWLDCEALERRHNIGKGTLIVLDVVTSAALDYEERRRWLEGSFPLMDINPSKLEENAVIILPSWDSVTASGAWDELPKHNTGNSANWFYEGLVAKRLDSRYPIQLHSPDATTTSWVKFRYKW
jgi:hypothetical protein